MTILPDVSNGAPYDNRPDDAMSFDVSADAYQRFMGRYSDPLGATFVEQLDLHAGQRVLDVGAGPGALTVLLAAELGVSSVAAIDPSTSFVAALRERLPGLDAREATADALPFASDTFDLAAAQLVVHFMPDPVAGFREMARAVRPGGTVAASGWDFAGGRSPLALFWQAAHAVDPDGDDDAERPGGRAGALVDIFEAAGLRDVRGGEITVSVPYRDIDDWWQPYELGVGPAGAYLAGLPEERRNEIKERAIELVGTGAGTIEATAWTAFGTV